MIATEHRSAATPTRSMRIVLTDCSKVHVSILAERPSREVPHEDGADFERPD
jgi:hypothetical protein